MVGVDRPVYGVRNCISQVAEAEFYEKDSFLFTVDELFYLYLLFTIKYLKANLQQLEII